MTDRNGHRRTVVSDGKSGRCIGGQSKGEGCKYKIDQKIFLQSDLLKLWLKQNQDITKFFPDNFFFKDENNLCYDVME